MKNIMTKLKTLAVAGMTMGLALGAQAGTKVCTDCLTFSAEDPFGLILEKGNKNGIFDGDKAPFVNLEWSTNRIDWAKFEQRLPSQVKDHCSGYPAGKDGDRYKLYLRGTNNTYFAYTNTNAYVNRFTNTWDSAAKKIACSGNIETLLDWKTVAKGEHPKMAPYAFSFLFRRFRQLETPPDLPATNLTAGCYDNLFGNCFRMTKAPVLPATVMAQECYQNMFKGCSALCVSPELPSTNLADNCYYQMFYGTGVKDLPNLPAKVLKKTCYNQMFFECGKQFGYDGGLVVNTNGPGRVWSIPQDAVIPQGEVSWQAWNYRMFFAAGGNITNETNAAPIPGKTYYIASAPKAELTVTPVTGVSTVKVMEETWEVTGPSYSVYQGNSVTVTCTVDEGHMYSGGTTTWSTNFTATADSMILTPPTPIEITCERTQLKDGESTNLVAGVYTAAPTTQNGGVVEVQTGGNLTGENVTFADNSANSGGAIYNSGTVTLSGDASFIANAATDNKGQTGGGAIYNTSDGTVSVEGDATFRNNTTANGGGAIFNKEGTVSVAGNATFDDNTAVLGGAICLAGGTVSVAGDATFSNNTATNNGGGAIRINYGNVKFSGTDSTVTFTGNKAVGTRSTVCGGAIYNSNSGQDGVSFAGDAVFSNNTASYGGGAIFGYGTISFAGDATFSSNTTVNYGGAIYNQGGTVSVAGNATFTDNSAKFGGAIYNDKSGSAGSVGVMNLGDAVFSNNTAASNGGAIYNGGSGVMSLGNATFTGNKVTGEGAYGGAIYNLGTVNMAGAVTLVTTNDTIVNGGLMNWDLTGEPTGVLNGYENLVNDCDVGSQTLTGALQITVHDYVAPTNIVIATGNFSDIEKKNARTFTITNALGGAAMTIRIDGGGVVGPTGGTVGYRLVTEAAGATTNLVLQSVTVKPRVVVDTSNSPYEIKDCTYTAVKTDEPGGAAKVEAGGVLVVSNVTFKYNFANGGSAIYIGKGGIATFADVTFDHNGGWYGDAAWNSGLLNLDGRVAFETFYFPGNLGGIGIFENEGTLNWNLTDGKAGLFCNYENLANDGGALQITVEDYEDETNTFVIATGSFLGSEDYRDTFTITNAANGAATTAKIDGGRVVSGGSIYQLETVEDLSVPTTNLVFTVIQPDMSHVIVNSNLAGKYKPGDEIEIEGETYYYGINCLDEIPHGDSLVGTETLEIAGGSAAITNEVTLKEGAQLVLKDGAALSILGDDAALKGLADTSSISGSGAIYVDKSDDDTTKRDYYKNKLAPGSGITVARASVTDGDATTAGSYKIFETDVLNPSTDTNEVITANLMADGEVRNLRLIVIDEKDLIAAGSLTATAGTSRELQLQRNNLANTGDLIVHGKVSGFETIVVDNWSATGKMVTTSTLVANKNILISNDGHLEAKALAGGNIDINNTSANTIIGEYSGQFVSITNTAKGVAQDITLQAYGKSTSAGYIRLFGADGSAAGSIYSNVTLVAGNNATPSDISANDGKGTIQAFDGINTLSGTVLMRGDKVSGSGGGSLRFENADVTCSAPNVTANTEIAGECNIASNDNGTVLFKGAVTLKDGAVLGGKTRLASTCDSEKFLLEGTVTLKDGAEVSRGDSLIEVPSDATLKLQGSKIRVLQGLTIFGTLDVEDGLNDVNKIGSMGTINLKGGELIIDEYLSNASGGGVLNWDLTAGTTTLDWSKVSGSGAWVATVGNVASGTSYTLATNATAFAAALTVTNSVAGGAAGTVKAGGVCRVAGQFWALDVKEGVLTLTALQAVQLTDVFLIDEEGKTNATAVVKFGDQTVEPSDDGSFEVPANYPFDVVYLATDDYMFGPGWKEKTVSLPNGVSGDGPMPAELKQQVANQCQECWVDSDGEEGGREIALDTRERIVVADLNDIQPIAYSTNNWDAYREANWVRIYTNETASGQFWLSKRENGYEEWLPQAGAYGKYDFVQKWSYLAVPGSSQPVDYGTTNATVWYGKDYQFVFDEDQMIYVQRPGDEYGLGNLEDVTSYTILNLKATPEYTNVDRYEFVSWKACSYAERDIGWKNPEECPQLAAQFGDINAAETTFEMPFTNVFITCSYQWKSNYNEVVSVEPGIYNAWEIHEGEKYNAGIATTNGSIVSFREKITTCFPVEVPLNLAAGATNIWDFTKNGRPCLEYFSRIKRADESAVKMVLFDGTLTNDTYKIAGFASEALGDTFLISDGSSAKECTVVAQDALETTDWVYVGAKRFKLYIDGSDNLQLLVEWGAFNAIFHYDAETVVTNRFLVNEGLALPTAWPEEPSAVDLNDWWNGKAEKVIAGWSATNEYVDAAGDLCAWADDEGRIDYYEAFPTNIPPMTLGDQEFWVRWSYVDTWEVGRWNVGSAEQNSVKVRLVDWTGEMDVIYADEPAKYAKRAFMFDFEDPQTAAWEDGDVAPWYWGHRFYVNRLTIDAKMQHIGKYAFCGCTFLREVFFEGAAPSYTDDKTSCTNAFEGCDSAVGYYPQAFEEGWTNQIVNGRWNGLVMFCREDVPTFAEAGTYVMMDVASNAVLTVAEGVTEVTCTSNPKGYVIIAPVGVTVNNAESKAKGRTEVVVTAFEVNLPAVTLRVRGLEEGQAFVIYGKKQLTDPAWTRIGDERIGGAVYNAGETTFEIDNADGYNFFTYEVE